MPEIVRHGMSCSEKLHAIKKKAVDTCFLSIEDGPIVIQCIEEAYELGVATPEEKRFVLPPNTEPIRFELPRNPEFPQLEIPEDETGNPDAASTGPKGGYMAMTAFGETKLVLEWVEDPRCKVSLGALYYRRRHGYNPEWSITTPSKRNVMPMEHVVAIYTGTEDTSVCIEKYGVTRKQVDDLRSGISFKKITKDL